MVVAAGRPLHQRGRLPHWDGCRTKGDREGRPYGWGYLYALNPSALISMPSPTCLIMPIPYF
jgi:hypothetical protein